MKLLLYRRSAGGPTPDTQKVTITDDPLDPGPLTEFVRTESDGAIVTFLGVTRNHNEGRRVLYLEYEAYRPMADRVIAEIIDDMKCRYEIGQVAVAHRTGRVDIGEMSMVVAVGAAHRRPAFEAALHFIDRLKQIVPIWKKEYFEGGEVWIGDTPGSSRLGSALTFHPKDRITRIPAGLFPAVSFWQTALTGALCRRDIDRGRHEPTDD